MNLAIESHVPAQGAYEFLAVAQLCLLSDQAKILDFCNDHYVSFMQNGTLFCVVFCHVVFLSVCRWSTISWVPGWDISHKCSISCSWLAWLLRKSQPALETCMLFTNIYQREPGPSSGELYSCFLPSFQVSCPTRPFPVQHNLVDHNDYLTKLWNPYKRWVARWNFSF